METFVETAPITGATYKASERVIGWRHAEDSGDTTATNSYDKPNEAIWLRPLRKDMVNELFTR